jgi:hypothetical protein
MRNPDRNFDDQETGIAVKREVETVHPMLTDQKNKTLVSLVLEGTTRFIEPYELSTEELKQFRELYGKWGTESWIVYFDLVAGDQNIIKQCDYIYFNRSKLYQNTAYDPLIKDTVRLVIKNIPIYAGLNQGLSGVDCGMLECICYAS